MNEPSSKLVHLLICKSILETVLVGAIAAGVYLTAFPPTFHGWGEAVGATRSIAGWAVNNATPWERVEVQLFVDGRFISAQVAHLSRPDVFAAGWSKDEWHGYNFTVPELTAGSHEAQVYALHQSSGGARLTLQLLGDPVTFVVNADGRWQTNSND